MTKTFTIPCDSHDIRVQLVKQFRAELGPIGNTWSICTAGKNLEVRIKYPEECPMLTMLMLKYGDQIKVRNG
jgi:hypothetical protein